MNIDTHSIPVAGMNLGTKIILLAEDNPVNQMVVERMLSRLGHKIDVVDNGRLAVEAATSCKYDLVFMDLMMPLMGGIEATLDIRAREPCERHLPIIALTARVEPKDIRECQEAGMDGFISKPFTLRQLEEAVIQIFHPDLSLSTAITAAPGKGFGLSV